MRWDGEVRWDGKVGGMERCGWMERCGGMERWVGWRGGRQAEGAGTHTVESTGCLAKRLEYHPQSRPETQTGVGAGRGGRLGAGRGQVKARWEAADLNEEGGGLAPGLSEERGGENGVSRVGRIGAGGCLSGRKESPVLGGSRG